MLNANEIQTYMSFFKGSSKAFMEQQSNGGYFPNDRPLEEADIKDHLEGHKTVGAYLIDTHALTGVVLKSKFKLHLPSIFLALHLYVFLYDAFLDTYRGHEVAL